MNHDVRSRIVLPIVIPIVILLSIAAFVGSMATLFLFNTQGGSIMLAAVAAGGILFTISLASSQDKLDGPRRFTLVLAAALPLLAGGAVALDLVGDVADEDRMINVQPLVVMPDGAPTIAAENATEFCLGEEGECEEVRFWEVEPGDVSDPISYVFENRDDGVPHNVTITSLEGTVDDPQRGDEVFAASGDITGPAVVEYVHPDAMTWEELPDEWFFWCSLHPPMYGAGVVITGDE